MDNTRSLCNICDKRVLSHSHHLQCVLCQCLIHVKCLPFVSKNDDIYVKRKENKWFCTLCMKHILPFNHYEEEKDFTVAILENKSTDPVIPLDDLLSQNKLFIPFELNDDDSSPVLDIDPDLQYYNTVSNMNMLSCNYHVENTFNNKISDLDIRSDCLSMIHSNIRSIPKMNE